MAPSLKRTGDNPEVVFQGMKRARKAPPRADASSDIEVLETSTSQATSTTAFDIFDTPESNVAARTDDLLPWFDLVGRKDQTPVFCKVCKALYEGDTPVRKPTECNYRYSYKTSTTTLRGHIASWHKTAYLRYCESNNLKIGYKPLRDLLEKQGSILSYLEEGIDSTRNGVRPFSVPAVQDALVRFLVSDDQSLNIVECGAFRALLQTCSTDLVDSDIPHRTLVREQIFRTLTSEFHKLRNNIQNNAAGLVSFTADIWTNQNLDPFIGVTAHYIERRHTGKLRLRADLIAFRYFPGSHTGANIAMEMIQIVERAGLLNKIGWFTLDNASNNDTFMTAFAAGLKARGIDYDPIQGRIRCFPHIIHLVVTAMLGVCTSLAHAADTAADFVVRPPAARYAETPFRSALDHDIISMSRSLIRNIRASSARRESFRRTQLSEAPDSPPKQLLRDCPTRWSSLFFMIDRLIELRPAVETFIRHPANKDLEKYGLSPSEWDALILLRDLLKIPHSVQQLVSGDKTPLLMKVLPAFEQLGNMLKGFQKDHPESAIVVKPGLEKLVKYYNATDLTKSYALNQVLNPAFKLTRGNAWTAAFVKQVRGWLKSELTSYCQEDLTAHSNSPSRGSAELLHWGALGLTGPRSNGDQALENEMTAYLVGTLAPLDVDIVSYWAENRRAFPTLYKLAMDYLPIQASAVPCERVFSSGKETDTKRRNRLAPSLMEALQLLKFLFKRNTLDFTQDLRLDDRNESEEELTETGDVLQSCLNAGGDLQAVLRGMPDRV